MKEATSNTNLVLEVLIATMNRTSLSFIEKMFPHNKLENLILLIINQTKPGHECVSDFENIRVINTYETGLSKSRNLAIKNSVGDICLIADDDVEYVKHFDDLVKDNYHRITNASIILFKIDTFTGEDYKTYPKVSKQLLTRNSIKPTSSIEMTFKREDIVNSNMEFNTLFGLGSYFTAGEEYLFLRDALQQDLIIYFEKQAIVKHALERSTSDIGSDNYVKTISALNYLDFKSFSYLLLAKYLFYLLIHKVIGFKDIIKKFRVGVIAINKCKSLSEKL
ncbi:glycosyltransferase family 2 protein [Algibacter sp.]|nr:glycosyltransferase family A protein [Algibacter sp.]MDA9069468.1 glycosyltransferase family 2 protein [Algibacter sp.]MDA9343687.1 glycosyltransferase family 2 protein [Algibacter sp.]